MSDWWSYRPQDFLMFSPHTYWRLFELQNDAWWPLPLWCVVAGLAGTVWLGLRPRRGAHRVALGLAAAAWGFAGWAFVWQRYAPINLAASVFAVGFAVQAVLLGGLATFAKWPDDRRAAIRGWRRRIGMTLLGWAMVGQPLLAGAFDRPWIQAEVFALAPDPTAIGTLGLLLWIPSVSPRAVAALVPLVWTLTIAWCAISAATLWTMGSMQGWVPAGAALIALSAAALGQRNVPASKTH